MGEELETSCFQIISNVGAARSSYIEAIEKAKAGDFDGARACMEEGKKQFLADTKRSLGRAGCRFSAPDSRGRSADERGRI